VPPLAHAGLYAVVLLNLTRSPYRVWNLEVGALSYLGKLSYGFYMYHMVGIVAAFAFAERCGLLRPAASWRDPVIYAVGLAGTLALAVPSYHFLETPLLRLGRRAPVDGAVPS